MFQKLILGFLFAILMQNVFSQEGEYKEDTIKRNNYLGIGKTYQRAQDYRKSIEYFNKALKYDSTSIEAVFYLAVSHFRLDEHKEVIEIASRVLDTTSQFPSFYDLRGVSYVSIEEWERGFNDLDKCISLGYGDGGTFHARGFCLIHLGKYDQAIYDFERAIEFNHKACESKALIAFAYLSQDEFLIAEKKIEEFLLSTNEKNCNLSIEKIEYYKMKLGTIYYELGKHEKSVSILSQSHNLGYNSSLSFLALAYSYMQLGKLKESKETLLKAIEIYPDVKDYYLMLARLNFSLLDDTEPIKEILYESLDKRELIGDTLYYYKYTSLMFLFFGDLDNALSEIEEAEKLYPTETYVHQHKLFVLEQGGSRYVEEIIKTANTLISHHPHSKEKMAFYLRIKSSALKELDDLDNSLKAINEAIELDPYCEYFISRVLIYLQYIDQKELSDEERLKLEQKIMQDFETAMNDVNCEDKNFIQLKIMALMYFDKDEQACEEIKKILNRGERLPWDQNEIDAFCDGIPTDKKSLDIHFQFNPSNFNKRFEEEVIDSDLKM